MVRPRTFTLAKGEVRANFVAALGPGWASAGSWEGMGVTGLNMLLVYEDIKNLWCLNLALFRELV